MNRIFAILLTLYSAVPSLAYEEISVDFYSETVKLQFDNSLLTVQLAEVDEPELRRYFREMSTMNYNPLLANLQRVKRRMRLNDWLFYQLIQKTLQEAMPERPERDRVLLSWFLISRSGYDTRLAYTGEEVFLYVYTQDDIYEAPMIQDGRRNFINLTRIRQGREAQRALYLLGLQPNPSGHSFSFMLQELPLLKPELTEVELRYLYKGEWAGLTVTADATIKAYMDEYPVLSESQYLKIPFSPYLSKSLLPHMKAQLADKNEWQSTEFIAAFTRSAFEYKEDKEHFGCSKPMVAEEVFLYPYSDCEDRTALFYNLVSELLSLPMILIAYPDHLTMGVALPQSSGSSVRYKDNNYYICDPTGPIGSHEIGRVPQGYEQAAFKVIAHFP